MAILEKSPWYQEIKERGAKQSIFMGMEVALDIKFGESGLSLLPEIKQIEELKLLEKIVQSIKETNSPEELRKIYIDSI